MHDSSQKTVPETKETRADQHQKAGSNSGQEGLEGMNFINILQSAFLKESFSFSFPLIAARV